MVDIGERELDGAWSEIFSQRCSLQRRFAWTMSHFEGDLLGENLLKICNPAIWTLMELNHLGIRGGLRTSRRRSLVRDGLGLGGTNCFFIPCTTCIYYIVSYVTTK